MSDEEIVKELKKLYNSGEWQNMLVSESLARILEKLIKKGGDA